MWPPPLDLTEFQLEQLAELEQLALRFNTKHNLYSQASTKDFRQRHLAHSLTLATRPFPPDSVVADWGTGGGMPGLVLAIVFPETSFHLIDSVGKKIQTVRTIARRLGLPNVLAHHSRAEHWEGRVTHSVSRATAPLSTLWDWHRSHCVPQRPSPGAWEPGLLCLKGGNLREEIQALESQHPRVHIAISPLPAWVEESALEDKVLLEVKQGVSRETS